METSQENIINHQFGVNIIKKHLALIALLILTLTLKLVLININQAEYTDGIIQLSLWDSPVVFFPPGYSAAVWLADLLMNDLLISGRLVSILASVFSLIVVYSLANLIFQNRSLAFWATLFLALSPIYNRWSLRVMTDSLFLLMFLMNCRELFLVYQNKNRPLSYLFCYTGLATLVRYQGLYFLPFGLWFLWDRRSNLKGKSVISGILRAILAFIPYIILLYWIQTKGFGHQEQFLERGSHGFWLTASAYFNMFETFVLYWPWAVTYALFALGIMGLVAKKNQDWKAFIGFFFITSIVFLIVQSMFLSFQYRYLLPLVPLWCILAAQGMGWVQQRYAPHTVKVIQYAVIINLLIMSIAVLMFQRQTFGTIADSAKALKVVGRESRVLSDEVYREGVTNVKMEFWSGRKIDYIYTTEPQAGDIVVLHNSYSDLSPESPLVKQLQEDFIIERMAEWRSNSIFGEYTTLPLLPDIMVAPRELPLTSNPPCMSFRFVPQPNYSIMIRLKAKP